MRVIDKIKKKLNRKKKAKQLGYLHRQMHSGKIKTRQMRFGRAKSR